MTFITLNLEAQDRNNDCSLCHKKLDEQNKNNWIVGHYVTKGWDKFHGQCLVKYLQAASSSEIENAACPKCRYSFSHIDGKPFSYFLSTSPKPSEEFVLPRNELSYVSLKIAMREKSEEEICAFLSNNQPMPQQFAEFTLILASAKGYSQVVSYILAISKISKDIKGDALIVALKSSHPSYEEHFLRILNLLVPDAHSIPDYKRWTAVERIAELGWIGGFRYMESKFPIHDDLRGSLLNLSIKNNHNSFAKEIYSKTIPPIYLSSALKEAAKNGNIEMFKFLIQTNMISKEDAQDAVAAFPNQVDRDAIQHCHLMNNKSRACTIL